MAEEKIVSETEGRHQKLREAVASAHERALAADHASKVAWRQFNRARAVFASALEGV